MSVPSDAMWWLLKNKCNKYIYMIKDMHDEYSVEN